MEMILDPHEEAIQILLDSQAILEVRGRTIGEGALYDGPVDIMTAVALAQYERRLPVEASVWDKRIAFRAATLSTVALRKAANDESECTPAYLNDVVYGDVYDEDDNEDLLGVIDHAISLLAERAV
jgi:hypothetical protein